METVLFQLNRVIKMGFFAGFSILFYISLCKCFLKEKKGRIRMFIISVFAGPVSMFCESFLIIQSVTNLLIKGSFDPDGKVDNMTIGQAAVYCLATGCLYLILSMLYSLLIVKSFRVGSFYPVMFISLMFSTILLMSLKGTGGGDLFSDKSFGLVVDIGGQLILYFAAWLFYRLIVCPVSKMTGDFGNVDWKIFIIPPAAFVCALVTLVVLMAEFNGFMDSRVLLTVYLSSSIIVFLFIWAFHVIMKNIKATNEAVKAKEEAVKAKDEVKTLSVEVMEALAHTIDAKDEYTRGHSVRVAVYSKMIAEKMGISAEECENVYYMGLLHDLGKIGVPNEIINSPTKLTDEEYAVIKTHPVLGYDILSEIKSRPDLVTGARWHHERYDGKGYPDGKSGEEIPLMARIIAVADSYDAMTSNRSYRRYMEQEKVRGEIAKCSGTQFDPEIAKWMIQIIDEDVEYKLHE